MENNCAECLATMGRGDLEALLNTKMPLSLAKQWYKNIHSEETEKGSVKEIIEAIMRDLYPQKEKLKQELRWLCQNCPALGDKCGERKGNGGNGNGNGGNSDGPAFLQDKTRSDDNENKVKAFLCHTDSDTEKAQQLHQRLKNSGISPWYGGDLLAGKEFDEIARIIHESDVIIVCLTERFGKDEGKQHSQTRWALDKAAEQPYGTISIIPAKLERCDVPWRLKHLQHVDLYEDEGYGQLIRALQHVAKERGKIVPGGA
jgi:hypothetical protein